MQHYLKIYKVRTDYIFRVLPLLYIITLLHSRGALPTPLSLLLLFFDLDTSNTCLCEWCTTTMCVCVRGYVFHLCNAAMVVTSARIKM